MQELERSMKKTEENFDVIRKNLKSYIYEDTLWGTLSAEKKNDELEKNNRFLEDNQKFKVPKSGGVPLRKSLDSNLGKSNNNFIEKIHTKHEVEGNLNEYILAKGGKIFNTLAQKNIFLTPKGMVYKNREKTVNIFKGEKN